MTKNSDFKKQVRAYAKEQGLPYSEARTRLLAAEAEREATARETLMEDYAALREPDQTTARAQGAAMREALDLIARAEAPGERVAANHPDESAIPVVWSWWGRVYDPLMQAALVEATDWTGRVDFIGSTPVGRWTIVGRGSDNTGDVAVYDHTGDLLGLLPHVVRHSPAGFGWGYNGSGAADLARSILNYVLGGTPDQVHHLVDGLTRDHLPLYQAFKEQMVARLPTDVEWDLSFADVESWINQFRVSIQPEARQDLSLAYQWHLYPGGVVGQQNIYRGDPVHLVGFSQGPEDIHLLTADDFYSAPEKAIGLRLVGRDTDPDGTMAAYGQPIRSVEQEPKRPDREGEPRTGPSSGD